MSLLSLAAQIFIASLGWNRSAPVAAVHAYMPLHCMTQAVTHIYHAIVRNCIADKKSGLRCFTVSLDNNLSSSACPMAGEHAFMTFPAQLGCHCSLLQRNLSLPAQVGTAVHL